MIRMCAFSMLYSHHVKTRQKEKGQGQGQKKEEKEKRML